MIKCYVSLINNNYYIETKHCHSYNDSVLSALKNLVEKIKNNENTFFFVLLLSLIFISELISFVILAKSCIGFTLLVLLGVQMNSQALFAYY